MKINMVTILKEFLFLSPFKDYFFPKFNYNFTVPQLIFLCKCLEEIKHIEGAVAEIGCAKGYTTLFLNKYMDAQHIKKKYYAIDTFSGFVDEDINYEIENRRKMPDFFTDFRVNKKKWFDGTMLQNDIRRVHSIEADVNEYDLTRLGPLSFALLDVDLYRPMKKVLPELYRVLNLNGIIIVDDCDSENIKWDGSAQAYREFMKEKGLPPRIIYNKLGIIKKSDSYN